MAGAYYIWIMGAIFLGCGLVVVLFVGILFLGHWLEKRQTGSTHGFMELPEELRSRPARSAADAPPPGAPPAGETPGGDAPAPPPGGA
jgi:hypothetical protein